MRSGGTMVSGKDDGEGVYEGERKASTRGLQAVQGEAEDGFCAWERAGEGPDEGVSPPQLVGRERGLVGVAGLCAIVGPDDVAESQGARTVGVA